jgi:hypothetical protein
MRERSQLRIFYFSSVFPFMKATHSATVQSFIGFSIGLARGASGSCGRLLTCPRKSRNRVLGENFQNFGTKPLVEMLDYPMVSPYRPSSSAKILQFSRKLLSAKRVRVGSTGEGSLQNTYLWKALLDPKIAWLCSSSGARDGRMDCRSKR